MFPLLRHEPLRFMSSYVSCCSVVCDSFLTTTDDLAGFIAYQALTCSLGPRADGVFAPARPLGAPRVSSMYRSNTTSWSYPRIQGGR